MVYGQTSLTYESLSSLSLLLYPHPQVLYPDEMEVQALVYYSLGRGAYNA
jgi:hypothetical protein